MIGAAPACLKCKFFHDPEGGMGLTCDAFPEGIPDSILMGDEHKEPVEGDHGIQFEPKESD